MRSSKRSWRSTSVPRTYLSANSSGAVLWRRLAGGATREDLVAELVAKFSIDSEQAGADVDLFLAELSAQGLLED